MESSLTNFLYTTDSGTAEFDGSIADSVDDAASVLTWLSTIMVDKVWQDPFCGNGLCEPPQEYPQFRYYGCAADCGCVC